MPSWRANAETELKPAAMAGLKLLVPETMVLDALDQHVSAAFEAALARLSKAGAKVTRAPFPVFDAIPDLVRKGGFSPPRATPGTAS